MFRQGSRAADRPFPSTVYGSKHTPLDCLWEAHRDGPLADGASRSSVVIQPEQMVHRPDAFSDRISGRDGLPDIVLGASNGIW